ncbi:unnamed protein product [Schistosoma turkestanicum]|nr:unnamed protein product [Schistosoma turkestanicum]
MVSLKRNKSRESSKKQKSGDSDNGVSENVPHDNTKTSDLICCKVRLLDDSQTPIEVSIKKTDKGSILFEKVCQSIGDLVECDYFGLRYTGKKNIRSWKKVFTNS